MSGITLPPDFGASAVRTLGKARGARGGKGLLDWLFGSPPNYDEWEPGEAEQMLDDLDAEAGMAAGSGDMQKLQEILDALENWPWPTELRQRAGELAEAIEEQLYANT